MAAHRTATLLEPALSPPPHEGTYVGHTTTGVGQGKCVILMHT